MKIDSEFSNVTSICRLERLDPRSRRVPSSPFTSDAMEKSWSPDRPGDGFTLTIDGTQMVE